MNIYASADEHLDGGFAVLADKPKLKKPPMYQVVIYNDDYTPMDFVVHVLMAFFQHDEDTATRLMMRIHQQGKAVAGVYSKDVAETKAHIVNQYSQDQEHPLMCDSEMVSDEQE